MPKQEKNIDVYEITFSSPEYKTLGEYIRDPGSPAFPTDKTTLPKKEDKDGKSVIDYKQYAEQFANYKNSAGISNREKIVEKLLNLSPDEKSRYLNNFPAYDLPLRVGTRFVVPVEKINRGGLLTEGIEVVSNDEPAFKAAMLNDLENDKGWERIIPNINGKIDTGIVKETIPNITVWIWCRSLSPKQSTDLNGQLFNITPFIQSLQTNSGKNGGNYELTLSPIICERDIHSGKWILKKSSVRFGKNHYEGNSSLFSEKVNKKTDFLKRNQFFFHNIIGSNDLIFIRFETLKLEEQHRVADSRDLNLDKNRLPGKIYDMIGLIDSNSISLTHNDSGVNIQVSGRDLSKLFIEDGTYFYALESSQGKLTFAGGSTSGDNELLRRLISDNSLIYLSSYFNNSIERILKFIIQHLSSISVVPDDLFEAYGDRRNTKYVNTPEQQVQIRRYTEVLKQKEELAKRLIKETRIKEGIINEDYYVEKREIENTFYSIKHFLKTASNTPPSNTNITDGRNSSLLSLGGNEKISGWSQFNYVIKEGSPAEVVRRDIFPTTFYNSLISIKNHQEPIKRQYDTNGVIDAVWNCIMIENSKAKYNPKQEEEFADGIWQIIKLVIDQGVTKRRIVDSSISSASGSLLNFIRKCCQEPLVEFYMDTYGDMYYLIVRKPPHDKQSMLSLLNNIPINTEEGASNSAVIDIDEIDVINENLRFNDDDVYSWYSFTPQGNFLGGADQYSLSYIPAIYFSEYAEIWGSRPLNIINNYLPYLPLDKQKEDQLSFYEKQAFYDMKYLVESNQYLPFTRKGLITLNGDRRIKIGNIIRFKPTGEIFFVDSVNQTYSIDTGQVERVTTISVSRGMVEQLIYGVDALDEDGNIIPGKKASYFNIINTELNFKEIEVDNVVEKEIIEEEEIIDDQLTGETGAKSRSPWMHEMLKKSEGFRSKPYLDGTTYAIGYGNHTYADGKSVQKDDPSINKSQAEFIYQADLVKREAMIRNKFRRFNLTQNQFDAILHYYYNTGNFYNDWFNSVSSYLDGLQTEEQLRQAWTQSAITKQGTNQVDQGLVNRRQKEVNWFLNRPIGQQKKVRENKKTISVIDPDNPKKKIIDRSQVFRNFKVNKEVFNFFLRKEQFNYTDSDNFLEGVNVYG